ncbi:MAG: DUF2934 domain-containing protein [Steroidobacteraceae bacterium]
MTSRPAALWFDDPCDQAAYRQAEIAKAAYFRAQHRGFAPGHELEDWLVAEKEAYCRPAHAGSQPSPAPP